MEENFQEDFFDVSEASLNKELDGIKYRVREKLHRANLFRAPLRDQFNFCFKAIESFNRALESEKGRDAYRFLVSVSVLAAENNLHDADSIDEEELQTVSEELASKLEDMLKKEEQVKNLVRREIFFESRVGPKKTLVKITTKAVGDPGSKTTSASASNTDEVGSAGEAVFTESLETGQQFPTTRFSVHAVLADGHCAFRAVTQGVEGGKLRNKEETESMLKLRKRVAELLYRSKDTQSSVGMTYSQLAMCENQAIKSFEEYCDSIRKNAYAGELEMLFISKDLNVNIIVLQLEGDLYKVIATYGDQYKKKVFLKFKTGKTQAGNHYDLLKPK